MKRPLPPRAFATLFFTIAAVIILISNRGAIGGDGTERWMALHALMEEGRLIPERFTLLQPLLASPLYALGALTFRPDRSLLPGTAAHREKRLRHIKGFVKRYNKFVAFSVLLWFFLALRRLYGFSDREAALAGMFLLAGSMLLPQAMDFYSECTWTLLSLPPLAWLSARAGGEEPFMRKEGIWRFFLPLALAIPLNPVLAPVFTAAALGAAALAWHGAGGAKARRALTVLLWTAAAIALGLLAALAENRLRRGSALHFGYSEWGYAHLGWFHVPLLTGVAGQLISPARGILFYAPAFFLGFLLLGRRAALPEAGRRFVQLALIYSAALLLAYSKWVAWHGAGGWGPRYLLPLSVFGAVFFCASVKLFWRGGGAALRAVLALAGAASVLGFLIGASINDIYLKQCYARVSDHESCYWELRNLVFASLLRWSDWKEMLGHRATLTAAAGALLFWALMRLAPPGAPGRAGGQ